MRASCVVLLSFAIASVGCRGRIAPSRQARAALPLQPARAAEAAESGDAQGQGQGGRGGNRWRDTGVYVDGKAVGVLSFGELPVTLKPIWAEEQKSAEIAPGSHAPGYVIIKERRYRFTEYLKSIGIDITRIKQLHLSGPRPSETLIASGAELRSKRAAGFMFRFGGGGVGGKAIPVVPNGFGNDMSPDKISAVMIYIDKAPPRLTGEGLELDGAIVTGVPYAGEPLHGGVRVYRDDKLVASLHRRNVVENEAAGVDADGSDYYKLLDVLQREGVDVRGLSEAWLIRDERRKEKLTGAELAQVTFELGAKKQNSILIGAKKLQAQVIALHTKPVRADQLPTILASESDD